MKRKYLYVSWLLIIALFVHSPLCLAANDNQSVQSNREDHMEVAESFSSKKEWREHLKESNKNHQKDALDHDQIQTVLKKKGIGGLSKYQYHQLLTEEQEKEIVNNELLIVFDGTHEEFKNERFNALFTGMQVKTDHVVGSLKKGYTYEEMLGLIGKLIEDPYVDLIQPNFVYESAGFMKDIDYTYTLTQAMEQVNATDAWDYGTGEGVVVGMIDSGMSLVAGQNIPSGLSESNCSLDDYCDYAGCTGHGTAVSTVIGGNGIYTGVAPGCEIYSVGNHNHKTIDGVVHTIHTSSEVHSCIEALVNSEIAPCKVINMSINIHNEDTLTQIQTYDDVLFVQAAGNDHRHFYETYKYGYEANYIRVAAVDRYDNLWVDQAGVSGSNYSPEDVHITAPGEALSLPISTDNMDIDPAELRYLQSGTSFAAPFVAGTAALIWGVNPSLTASEVQDIILDSADMVPGLDNWIQGSRRLNVAEAVRRAGPAHGNRSAVITTDGKLKVQEGDTNNWVTVDSSVKDVVLESGRILYQKENNHIYYRAGSLTSNSIALDTTGNAVTFKASGLNLYVHHSDNKLYRYKFNESTGAYVSGGNFTNIKYYAIEGNRLVLVYTGQPKQMRVFENAYKRTSVLNGEVAYTIYTVDSDITGIYMIGSRIHVLQGGAYNMFDSIQYSSSYRRMNLYSPFSANNISKTSMNMCRWSAVVSGNMIHLYNFYNDDKNGGICTPEGPYIISAPDNQTIDSVLIEDYRLYFKCGKNVYYVFGDEYPNYVKESSTASSFAVKRKRIAVLNTSKTVRYKDSAISSSYGTMHENVKKIVLGN